MQYLTDEHYAIAEANGIPKKNVYHRFYTKHWPIERAITEPLMIRTPMYESEWNEMKEIATSNGITRSHFGHRMRRGWSKEKSAGPPVSGQERIRRCKVKFTKNDPYLKLALANGIKRSTYDNRIRIGWEPELAATTLPGTYVGRYARKRES